MSQSISEEFVGAIDREGNIHARVRLAEAMLTAQANEIWEEAALVAENCEPTPDGDDPYCTAQIAAAIRSRIGKTNG